MVLALGVVLAATRAGFCRVDSMVFFLLRFALRGVGRPTGGLNAELLCVLGVQSLPAAELHGLATNHAADGSSAEMVIQYSGTTAPPGYAHRAEAPIDVDP